MAITTRFVTEVPHTSFAQALARAGLLMEKSKPAIVKEEDKTEFEKMVEKVMLGKKSFRHEGPSYQKLCKNLPKVLGAEVHLKEDVEKVKAERDARLRAETKKEAALRAASINKRMKAIEVEKARFIVEMMKAMEDQTAAVRLGMVDEAVKYDAIATEARIQAKGCNIRLEKLKKEFDAELAIISR